MLKVDKIVSLNEFLITANLSHFIYLGSLIISKGIKWIPSAKFTRDIDDGFASGTELILRYFSRLYICITTPTHVGAIWGRREVFSIHSILFTILLFSAFSPVPDHRTDCHINKGRRKPCGQISLSRNLICQAFFPASSFHLYCLSLGSRFPRWNDVGNIDVTPTLEDIWNFFNVKDPDFFMPSMDPDPALQKASKPVLFMQTYF